MPFDGDYSRQDLAQTSFQAAAATGSLYAALVSRMFRNAGFGPLAGEFAAVSTMYARGAKNYGKPDFNLPSTEIDGVNVSVQEEVVLTKDFGRLIHFRRETERKDPKILLVAPLSGHYATLLRGTVAGMLPHHDVYVTEWANARDVPREIGKFDIGDYTRYLMDYMEHLGPDTHVVAVCQPGPLVLSAVSLMATQKNPNQPISMTLMGSPIDPAAAPTAVTRFADSHNMEWFEENPVSLVPLGYPGYGRPVYPGYKQLTAFLGMNPGRHVRSQAEMYDHLRQGDGESARKKMAFYDEYLAVMDMPAEFYLDTIAHIYKKRSLPNGTLIIENQYVRPSDITDTALFTVEGAQDDICAPGQTAAAHNLCNNIAPQHHFHYIHPKAGHYGIFEGSKFLSDVLPRIASFVRNRAVDKGLNYSEIPPNTRLIPPNLWGSEAGLSAPALRP